MQRTYLSILIPIVIALLAGVASAQMFTVDDIIAKHVEAIGGQEAIASLQNLVYRNGTYREGEYSSNGNASMSVARPYFKLVGDKADPGGYMEGYDGAAWEWFADPGVVIRTVGPASEAIRHYAGVESPLIDFREKGSVAEFIGETIFDERPVLVIRLTRLDGFIEQFYIDQQSYLVLATSGEAPIHAFGDEVTTLTRRSDYRPVGGVLIAHAFDSVQMPSGDTLNTMQWGSIVANQDLPDDWFSAPEFDRTPVQRLVEQLYDQRADPQSVMWTYRHFRAAYPDIDTSEAVNMAGFQTLKMGEIEGAITILQRNVLDYPHLADAHFELGRAYDTGDRSTDAREQFLVTLELDPDHRRAKRALSELTQ